MGRPPGVKNGAGNQGGNKNGTKTAGGGGKSNAKPSNVQSSAATTSGNVSEKEKTVNDRSQSNFPYDIRLNSYASLHNAVTKGTPRVKRVLTEEADFIIECRVCRNLFRSLPNFITHKLNYCKKAFDSTWCLGLSNLIETGGSQSQTSFNVEYEVDPELVFVDTSGDREGEGINATSELQDARTKSVAELYSELAERSKTRPPMVESQNTDVEDKSNVVRLQVKPLMIPGESGASCSVTSGGGMKSVVVQQRIVSNDPSNCDKSCTRPVEIVRKDTAILGPDGKVICTAPSKGIEQVVQRLTAQLKALEEKEAQKLAAIAKSTIICDICKTVFDSDKALRQHKRESLDCGRIWGFKSPSTSSERSRKPSGDTMTPNTSGEVSQSVRRLMSPTKGRRLSHPHHPLNGMLTNKTKRNSPLSPVKKIKMKYIKLDSSSASSRDSDTGRKLAEIESTLYSCSRCSSSFNTKHEMSMHLALCTGVINYAYTRESEPPQEKIRISLRNDFPKTSPVQTPSTPPMNSIDSESHVINRQRHVSGALSSRGNTPTIEVNNNNNNKQLGECYHQQTSTSSSSEEDDAVLGSTVKKTGSLLAVEGKEEEADSEHDSGVSSASSSNKRKPVVLPEAPKRVKAVKPVLSASSKKASDSASISETEKARQGGVGGILSQRPDPKNMVKSTTASTIKGKNMQYRSTTLNLRKAIHSRVRKSRRIPNLPAQ